MKVQSGLLILLFLFGCQNAEVIHFYPKDRSQCVTVINDAEFRYIMNGKHLSVPDDNYVKLSTKKLDKVSDILYICWRNQNYEWEIVANKTEIIENKLDLRKFSITNNLPEDDRGIPVEIKFRQEKCAIFYFYLMELTPDKGAIVEIVR